MNSSPEEAEGLGKGWLAAVALGVVVLWAVAWILMVKLLVSPEERGQFGDMFGSVNALFSGLALGGVVLTLFLQHHELSLQRRELALTRKQLARTAKAQEASEAALSRQAEIARLVAIVDHYRIRMNNEGTAAKKIELQGQQTGYIAQLAQLVPLEVEGQEE